VVVVLLQISCLYKKKPLTEDQISVIIASSLKGLAYLHAQNKIHRDIKAGNILLNDEGEVKLADFGVSAQLNNAISKRQTVIGTPYWMAPEVINENEKGYDAKCDIWSIGITAIEMAELKPPYHAIHPMRAIFVIPNRDPPKFSEPKKWSEEFNDFIKQCLIKNPDERWAAKDLLKHKFVKKAKPNKFLIELIDKTRQILIEAGGKEKFYEKEKLLKEKEKLDLEKKKKNSDSESTDEDEDEDDPKKEKRFR